MYTLEVYKADRRTKAGERLVEKIDYDTLTQEEILGVVRVCYPTSKGFRTEIHETYVTRKVLGTDKEFQERYDTPYYCSPSSETYWSM